MRIVCTVTNDLSHDQRMERICRTLVAGGHTVTLVGRMLDSSPPLEERPYRQHRIRCRYHNGKRFYAEYNLRLWRTLRNWEFDVCCSVDLDTLLAGWWLCRGNGRALVYDAHEWFSETPEVYSRPAVRMAWRSLGRRLVPLTAARYTVGPALAERLTEDYGRPFAVVRNVPVSVDKTFSENTEGVIVYQGMLNPGRGLETAIRALGDLPDCRLWIIGSGPERATLEALADAGGVADRVWFAGFRSPHELPELTRRAWLGINLLAGSSPSYYYSLANKALDYVQAGLPSIQMDFPEYAALNREYGCFELLPELDAATLAKLIRRLKDEPDRYRQLRDNCRRAAGELCWEREAPKLREIYESVERGLRS